MSALGGAALSPLGCILREDRKLGLTGSIASHCSGNRGDHVDRVLRGEEPGNRPFQEPTKYELWINRRTATALGLTIPERLLATAHEVID